MNLAVTLLGLVVMVLLTGTIPFGEQPPTLVFSSPAFLALLAVLALLLIAVSSRRRQPLVWLGFAACHLAPVLILAGALQAHLVGQRRELVLFSDGPGTAVLMADDPRRRLEEFLDHVRPVLEHALQVQIDPARLAERLGGPARRQTDIPLGFTVALRDFRVTHHPPDYQWYELREGGWVLRRSLRMDRRSDWQEAGLAAIAEGDLRDGDDWREQVQVTGTTLLRRGPLTPRRFSARLIFNDDDGSPIAVNHPVEHAGWRFYLTGFAPAAGGAEGDPHAPAWSVTLSVRKDPGRPMAIVGLWLLIVGTFALCLRRRPCAPPSVRP
jgi:hypothetical protein